MIKLANHDQQIKWDLFRDIVFLGLRALQDGAGHLVELDDDPAALAGADEGVGAVVGVHDHEREGSHQTWNGDSFDQMILDILDLFETLNPHKLEQKVYFIIS